MCRALLNADTSSNRDSAFLAALKQALSPSSPRRRLREAVLLHVGGEALPRLAAGVDTLPLSQVLAPFPSQEDETRFRQEARDGIMDLLKLLFEVRRRTAGKRTERQPLWFPLPTPFLPF